jgi:hypothetical protein
MLASAVLLKARMEDRVPDRAPAQQAQTARQGEDSLVNIHRDLCGS